MSLHVIILAAGKGTRMRSKLPKVLHKLGGKPMLERIITTVQKLDPEKIHVVYGSGGTLMRKYFANYNINNINLVEQKKQLGTGHAVMRVLPLIKKFSKVLILYGDVPLITVKTLKQLSRNMPKNGMNLLTANFSDPYGFGRIVRDDSGAIKSIVEHKDASSSQLQIKEINSGILATTVEILQRYLHKVRQNNKKKEYYLTDIIAMMVSESLPVNTLLIPNPEEVMGANTKQQLAKLERKHQETTVADLMAQGLTLMDPARLDVRGDLSFANDVTIDVNVILEGKVSIGANTIIGPNNFLKNVKIGKNVVIKANCVMEDAVIADNCIIGPFACIRPGTVLSENVHIGNFVEIKKTKIGKNSKANHLTYLGDAIIGSDVNVGAGTITVNYDGVNKYKTIIESDTFVGSNTSLIAPVKIGKGATIGAGSVITENAPAKKLTLARAKQVTIKNWQRKKK